MTKAEAVKLIMAQSDNWLQEKYSDEEFYNIIESYVAMVKMTSQKPENIKCPECDGEMVARQNRVTGEKFWGCTKYPNCRGTRDSEGKSKEDRKREKEKPEPIDEHYRFRKG